MDGYWVMPLMEAARIGDIFISVTGDINVLDEAHFDVMKDGVILANSGHFNDEINIPVLERQAKQKRRLRRFVDDYELADGRHIFLLGEGRLVNLAAAEGHPASVMDMSFANQALCSEYMVNRKEPLTAALHPVPREIDNEVARLKLHSMGVSIDSLTDEQRKYLASWESGT
jgi:adenosylhomocysteinase